MDEHVWRTAGPPRPARADADPAVPLWLRPADWEDVLDALGAAAERTSAGIDCLTCATAAPCMQHDADWTRVDRWRTLAAQLRGQLATAAAH